MKCIIHETWRKMWQRLYKILEANQIFPTPPIAKIKFINSLQISSSVRWGSDIGSPWWLHTRPRRQAVTTERCPGKTQFSSKWKQNKTVHEGTHLWLRFLILRVLGTWSHRIELSSANQMNRFINNKNYALSSTIKENMDFFLRNTADANKYLFIRNGFIRLTPSFGISLLTVLLQVPINNYLISSPAISRKTVINAA